MIKRLWFGCLMVALLFAGCSNKQYYEESGSVFHTLYRIKYEAPKLLTDSIDKELQDFNLSLNPFNPNSIIAKVNRNEPVEVDDWFIEVFNKAKEVSEHSNGVFDATGAPLFNLWGFGFEKMDSITPQMVDSILEFVGYDKIRLEGRRVVKDDPRVMLNFSAIAKGYACDVIAKLLERQGVSNYMVDIGSEIVMRGENPNGNCWRIGINKPEDDTLGINMSIEEVVQPCIKCGIATSGDYRNYYEKDGKKVGHTINPRTGYPAAQNVLSATVIADNCMTADAYATTLMALGKEKAVELATSIPEIEYFLIYVDENGKHQTTYSRGMVPYMPNRQQLDILENP